MCEIKKMTYEEWEEICESVSVFKHTPHNPLRVGQELFNELYDKFPDIASEITGADFDPFYDDDNIPAFLSGLLSKYVEEEE